MSEERNTKPAHVVRIGKIQAAVYPQKSPDTRGWYSVHLARRYTDVKGNTKTAQSLGRDDLLVAAEVLRQAYLWIAARQAEGVEDA